MLTDYERLPDFVPNLAVSQRLKTPMGMSDKLVVLRQVRRMTEGSDDRAYVSAMAVVFMCMYHMSYMRLTACTQVGFKRMLYMSLHAESVISLVEKPCREIQFKQVSGDFDLLQGKWMLQEDDPQARCIYYYCIHFTTYIVLHIDTCDMLSFAVCTATNPPQVRVAGRAPVTTLKYALETRLPRSSRLLWFLEPLLERVVYEDVPANLAAIKGRVELQRVEAKAAALEEAGAEDMCCCMLARQCMRSLCAYSMYP